VEERSSDVASDGTSNRFHHKIGWLWVTRQENKGVTILLSDRASVRQDLSLLPARDLQFVPDTRMIAHPKRISELHDIVHKHNRETSEREKREKERIEIASQIRNLRKSQCRCFLEPLLGSLVPLNYAVTHVHDRNQRKEPPSFSYMTPSITPPPHPSRVPCSIVIHHSSIIAQPPL
jgi:hypothetical protein